MAGSYRHIIDDQGHLVDNETFVDMVENLGDAYETVEEMFGMIWALAMMLSSHGGISAAVAVARAREVYENGLIAASVHAEPIP